MPPFLKKNDKNDKNKQQTSGTTTALAILNPPQKIHSTNMTSLSQPKINTPPTNMVTQSQTTQQATHTTSNSTGIICQSSQANSTSTTAGNAPTTHSPKQAPPSTTAANATTNSNLTPAQTPSTRPTQTQIFTPAPSKSTMGATPSDNDDDDATDDIDDHTFIPSRKHKYWKIATNDSHQPHRFLQYMENIKLMDDSIISLRQFYERICLAFHSSFNKVVDILPQFKDILSQDPFGNILVPHNEYYLGYHAILNTYNWFGTALNSSLTDPKTISPKHSPLVYRVILTGRAETD